MWVERLDDGEVSPYLAREAIVGEQLEIRGPLGGWFIWRPSQPEPVQLIAGGSGLVPLMSMLRHRARAGSHNPTRLLFSSRHLEEIIYREELDELASNVDGLDVFHTLTRSQPPAWPGFARRIDEQMLAEVLEPMGTSAQAYLCGPTALVETAADALVRLGLPPDHVRTERFGPSGT